MEKTKIPNSGNFMVKAPNQVKDGGKKPSVEEGADLRANKSNNGAK